MSSCCTSTAFSKRLLTGTLGVIIWVASWVSPVLVVLSPAIASSVDAVVVVVVVVDVDIDASLVASFSGNLSWAYRRSGRKI